MSRRAILPAKGFSSPHADSPKSTKSAWAITLSIAIALMTSGCSDALDSSQDSAANDAQSMVQSDAAVKSSSAVVRTVNGVQGRPTISAASTMKVATATAANHLDFVISGTPRRQGGFQAWTDQSWAKVTYLGQQGAYRVTVDTTQWGAIEEARSFNIVASNDSGTTNLSVSAMLVAPQLTESGSTGADSGGNGDSASTVSGVNGRPTVSSASVVNAERRTKTSLDFTISGPTRSAGGYQAWTDVLWASVSYSGTPGEYRVSIDTSRWSDDETTRSFNLIANNDAGETAKSITVSVAGTLSTPVTVPVPVKVPVAIPTLVVAPVTPVAPTATPTPTATPSPVRTVFGIGGRPTLIAVDSMQVGRAAKSNTKDFTISGPVRSDGGYQAWTDQPWAKVSYLGTTGQYRVTVDTTAWASSENSRAFTLIANNNSGQTSLKVNAVIGQSSTTSEPTPVVIVPTGTGTTAPVTAPVPAPAPTPVPVPVPSPTPTPSQPPVAAAGSCTAESAPGSIKTSMVTPDSPVYVPANYLGIHRGLQTPAWMPNAYSEIPAPTYPYGFVRNLRIEVGGREGIGQWHKLEVAPGVYHWDDLDVWMDANEGHPVVWTVYGAPTFYQKYPGERSRWPSWPGVASPPTVQGHAALKKFVQALKARYGSQIAAIEVWNEPTLPWTGNATSFNDRWTPAWGAANGQTHAPFFSGTASDLANIAYTLTSANLGIPVLGAGFVDVWGKYSTTVERFLNAPITLPGGWGTGKDHIQALSTHYYDYSFSPEDLIKHMDGYKAKLEAAGLGDMPIWGTETGAEMGGIFSENDWRAPINVQRWALIGAAKGLQSLILFGHFSGHEPVTQVGGPIDNPSVIASLTESFQIGGKTICNAAVLTDGRVWVSTAEGRVFLK